jgi:hypothetical protein
MDLVHDSVDLVHASFFQAICVEQLILGHAYDEYLVLA